MKTAWHWEDTLESARLLRAATPSWGDRVDVMRELYSELRPKHGPVASAGGALSPYHPRLGTFIAGAARPASIFGDHGLPYARLGAATSIAGLGGLAYGAYRGGKALYHHLTDPPPEKLAMDPTALAFNPPPPPIGPKAPLAHRLLYGALIASAATAGGYGAYKGYEHLRAPTEPEEEKMAALSYEDLLARPRTPYEEGRQRTLSIYGLTGLAGL